MAQEPSKMHAAKDKFIGGVKETLGTVVHAEAMKETGREQKREGDAEALAAGKGKKHYDPALARKGVGIQHKHLGPNPKKITEGPCAGCREGTCQVGHDYDAAVCHSCTQGHCDAHNVKSAGMGHDPKAIHEGHQHLPAGGVVREHDHKIEKKHKGDKTITKDKHKIEKHHVHSGAAMAGVPVAATYCDRCNKDYTVANYDSAHCPECMARGHNVAYDAAACQYCKEGTCTTEGHSKRDKEMMHKMRKEKAEHAHEKKKVYHADERNLDKELEKDKPELKAMDKEDKREMEIIAPKLHHVHD